MGYRYPNLAAEIARNQLDYGEVYEKTAKETGKSAETISNWVTGRAGEMTVKAAFSIRDNYFPSMSLDYLFSQEPILQ